MSDAITVDTGTFRKTLLEYAKTTRKTLAQIANQRAYNVAGRTMDSMKPGPGEEQSTRSKIRSYLNQQISTRIRLIATGKNKGRFKRRGARKNQLVLANLIIQKRRSKKGLKGLYGAAMRSAEGKFTQAAQVGVGFLKSPFVAVVRSLTEYLPPGPRMRIKTQWGRISIWPGSKGSGTINPAKPVENPTVSMRLRWRTKGYPTKVDKLIRPHLVNAFRAEEAELRRHITEKLQKEADKINSKR